MPIDPGALLGPYEILGPIGTGGMGEVYKARDTRLERTVAVKVSKQAFEQRFRNEALAIAKLNHPHIAALYDVGPDYLVMEHVEGKPLRGPVPLEEALKVAGQIASALEHAHERGIVHRDLKPTNILVTKSGAKVLDFGLAKRVEERPTGEESHSTLTEAGTVAGTPRYMAPEQIDGKAADPRTDIFAFGLVLYELLTGKHAFEGTSGARVMAAILEKDPTPISQVKPGTPPTLERVIATCLAKDPADRWQSVRELRHALEWAAGAAGTRPGVARAWAWLKWVSVAAALTAVAWGAASMRRGAGVTSPRAARLPITLPPGAVLTYGIPAVSPDGQSVALSLALPGARPSLFVRPLDALSVTPVPRTEAAMGPFWSPDSRRIAYWGLESGLHVAHLDGGAVQLVCPDCRSAGFAMDHGASWGTSGVILFSDAGRLFRVSARGGEPQALGPLAPGEIGRYWPQFLPDGRHFIYLSLASRAEERGIYVGALDSDLRRRIVAAQHTAAYTPPGYLIYINQAALVAQPFDAERLELSGEPVPILDEEVDRFAGTVMAGYAWFSVSTNGVLAWRPAPRDVRQLTWLDRAGRTVGPIGEPTRQFVNDLSADERFAAVCRFDSASNRDVWLVELASGASRRLTFDPHDDCGATFSPDGRRIAFFSDRRGVREIYVKPVDGSRDEELLLASSDLALSPENWSADGRFLTYNTERSGQGQDLFVLPLTPNGAASPVPFVATPARETWSTLSPDARLMAYQSNESGEFQVYVRELLASGRPGPGKWQISSRRGLAPVWRPDGKEIYFVEPPRLMAVEVRADGPTLAFGTPFPIGIESPERGWPRFYATRDGRRFLFNVPLAPPEPVRVLTNWLPKGS